VGAEPRAAAAGHGGQRPPRWRKFDPETFNDPDGRIADFGYDILKRSHAGKQYSAVAYLRRKLRWPNGLLNHAVPHRDVVATILLVPPACPDLLAEPDALWSRLDAEFISHDQHLLAGPTICFPGVASQHGAIRMVREFAQHQVVDRLDVAAQLVAHAPNRICLAGDFHIHLLFSARTIGPQGFGTFAQDILGRGCQKRMHEQWRAWAAGAA
jgi:hypothetical protein